MPQTPPEIHYSILDALISFFSDQSQRNCLVCWEKKKTAEFTPASMNVILPIVALSDTALFITRLVVKRKVRSCLNQRLNPVEWWITINVMVNQPDQCCRLLSLIILISTNETIIYRGNMGKPCHLECVFLSRFGWIIRVNLPVANSKLGFKGWTPQSVKRMENGVSTPLSKDSLEPLKHKN